MGGVVLIAALLVFLTCCVCLIVNCRIHADAKIDRNIGQVSLATLTKDKTLDEMDRQLEDVKNDCNQKVTHDGADEDARKQKILDFFNEMHKR